MSDQIMIGGELERVLRTNFDVLMDGYTWYTEIDFRHNALSLAVDLLNANPDANVQVRMNKIMERLEAVYFGEPEDSLAKVLS